MSDCSVFNVALDGPAGSGKSTIAKRLAADYGILYLDTGAIYRACGLFAVRAGVDTKDAKAVEKILPEIDVRVVYEGGAQHTYLGDEDVSTAIRQNEISLAASNISAHKAVREKLLDLQRGVARQTSCVLDGRDIGSTVLPKAKYKFFITADSRIRAMRRYKELLERGETPNFEELHSQIVLRDKQDAEREFSPLKQAEDAIVVDTSDMNVEQVVATIKSHIKEEA